MIDLTPLVRLGVLLVRPALLVSTVPLFGGTFAPPQVKIGLSLLLSVALLPSTVVPPVGEPIAIAVVVAREMAIGLALALAIRVLIAGAEFAGHLCGFQLGLSYSAIVDPQSGVRNNVIATLYSSIAVVTLFTINAHHAFLRALHASYARLPIGGGEIGRSLPTTVVQLLGLLFALGARLAAPLIVVMLVTELAMALIARSAPALNLYVAGPTIRLMVGLAVLGLVAPQASGVVAVTAERVLQLGVQLTQAFR